MGHPRNAAAATAAAEHNITGRVGQQLTFVAAIQKTRDARDVIKGTAGLLLHNILSPAQADTQRMAGWMLKRNMKQGAKTFASTTIASTARAPAKHALKYYKILQCRAPR